MKQVLLSCLALLFVSSCGSFRGHSEVSAPPSPAMAGSYHSSPERKIRKNGSMSIKTRQLNKSADTCVALVANHQGTLQSSRMTEEDYRATIRVPAQSLSPLMDSLSNRLYSWGFAAQEQPMYHRSIELHSNKTIPHVCNTCNTGIFPRHCIS